MTMHTPGPYKILIHDPVPPHEQLEEYVIVASNPGHGWIARIEPKSNLKEEEANVNLFVAAPDLLAACETIAAKITNEALDFAGPHGTLHVPLTRQEIEELQRAIAKAKGEQL